MDNFIKLWRQLETEEKIKFYLVLFLSLCATVAELLSVGALFPLLELALGSGDLNSDMVPRFGGLLGDVLSRLDFIAWVYVFVILLVCSYGLRFLYLWGQNSFSYSLGQKICEKVFRSISNSEYAIVSERNASFYVTSVTVKLAALIEGLIVPVVSVLSSLLMLVVITGALLYTTGWIALIGLFLIGAIYVVIMFFFKRALQRLSKVVNHGYEDMSQFAMAAKAGYREWKLLQAENFLFDKFSSVCASTLRAHSTSRILSSSPRLIIEPLLIIIGLMVIFLTGGQDAVVNFLPLIAVGAFALQRSMPYIQAAFAGWTYIRANEVSVAELLSQLSSEEERLKSNVVSFEQSIESPLAESIVLDSVSFRYPRGIDVFTDFSLNIKRGEVIGVVGASGSGKSTLINMILGFLLPRSGRVLPGIQAQSAKRVGYVSQENFILDGTVSENVALGLGNNLVDRSWLTEVLDIVELSDWLGDLTSGIESDLRSDGTGMSGGQRQRIGLARALYHRPEILILDEATSAIDSETENIVLDKVFKHVKSKGITVVFVTHRAAPLAYCDRTISL